MTARFLEEEKSNPVTTTETKLSMLDVQDDGYFATYDHYEIHQEMLQVGKNSWNIIVSSFLCSVGQCSNRKLFERDKKERRSFSR